MRSTEEANVTAAPSTRKLSALLLTTCRNTANTAQLQLCLFVLFEVVLGCSVDKAAGHLSPVWTQIQGDLSPPQNAEPHGITAARQAAKRGRDDQQRDEFL